MGSMMATNHTWADMQHRVGPPQLTHTISDVQHACTGLSGGGDPTANLEFNPHVPSLLSAASSMHSLLLGVDGSMNPHEVPATSTQLTSLFGLERANSVSSGAAQAQAEAGDADGMERVYAFFQVRSRGPLPLPNRTRKPRRGRLHEAGDGSTGGGGSGGRCTEERQVVQVDGP